MENHGKSQDNHGKVLFYAFFPGKIRRKTLNTLIFDWNITKFPEFAGHVLDPRFSVDDILQTR